MVLPKSVIPQEVFSFNRRNINNSVPYFFQNIGKDCSPLICTGRRLRSCLGIEKNRSNIVLSYLSVSIPLITFQLLRKLLPQVENNLS